MCAAGASSLVKPDPSITIRPATTGDVPIVLDMIKALAEYEKLLHQVVATEDILRESLFGSRPAAGVLLAFSGDRPIGFAVHFPTFSTFLGVPGIYLEDIFVLPQWRGRGIGRRLLARVARIAVERGYGRMEWSVLDWNTPAIGFYRKLGSQPMDEWTVHRLTGTALEQVAAMGNQE
jgi:GNAT superfamily N-acetyltransferase